MTALKKIIGALLSFAGVICIIVGLFTMFTNWAVGLSFFAGAAALMVPAWMIGKSLQDEAKDAISNYATRIGAGVDRVHVWKGTGIATLKSGMGIILFEEGFHKTHNMRHYPTADIREWKQSWVTPGKVVGGNATHLAQGVSDALEKASANSSMRRQAAKESGLFIDVRDVDHPRWKIEFPNEDELLKWFEIMNQTMRV